MELLIDHFRLDPIQIVSESRESGTMKIRGIFGRAEEFNNNNRRYPKIIMEREVTKLMPLVKENRLLGELDHPDTPTVKLTNASHMITNLYWQGNVLIGESQLLNTPAGKVAQQLVKDGVRIGVSSRGLGSLKPCTDAPGKFEVNEDYRAVTFDLVADPSTKGAYPSLVNESVLIEKTRKEALKNKVFMNLLESKLSQLKEQRINKLFFSLNEGRGQKKQEERPSNLSVSDEREPKPSQARLKNQEERKGIKRDKELERLKSILSSTIDSHEREELKGRIKKIKTRIAGDIDRSEADRKAHEESMRRRQENPDDDSWQRGRNDSTELKGNLVNEKKKTPCWKGYTAYGMKKKGGRSVPNCVPIKEEKEESKSIQQRIKELELIANSYPPDNKKRIAYQGEIDRLKALLKGKRTEKTSTVEEGTILLEKKSAAWQRSEGKDPKGGLNKKGVMSYRRENPGSKLQTAVTTDPSKLKKGSKAAKRRKSFCARMKGMRKRQKSSNNTGKDRLSLSLKKWNC